MIAYTRENLAAWSRLGAKKVVYVAAEELARLDERVVFITPDMCIRFDLDRFRETDPGRLIEVGISEQTMLGVAAGYAAEGFLPYAVAYAPFITARVTDQARVYMGVMNLPIVAVGEDAGFTMADLGPALMGLSDTAIMRTLPNTTIIEPADCGEIVKALLAARELNGPVYIRISGGAKLPQLHETDFDFTVGQARIEREGTDVSIVAAGAMVKTCLSAAELLKAEGIEARVVNMHTIKPLDEVMLDRLCISPLVVTCEEHGHIGGLGAAVAEYYMGEERHPRLLRIDAGEMSYVSDTRENSLLRAGLDAKSIAERIITAL